MLELHYPMIQFLINNNISVFSWDLAVVRITGVYVIAGCPQGESWLQNWLFCCRFPVIYPTPGPYLATATRKIGETETNSIFPIFHTRHNSFLSRYYTLTTPIAVTAVKFPPFRVHQQVKYLELLPQVKRGGGGGGGGCLCDIMV